jgi:hypothetical protein
MAIQLLRSRIEEGKGVRNEGENPSKSNLEGIQEELGVPTIHGRTRKVSISQNMPKVFLPSFYKKKQSITSKNSKFSFPFSSLIITHSYLQQSQTRALATQPTPLSLGHTPGWSPPEACHTSENEKK